MADADNQDAIDLRDIDDDVGSDGVNAGGWGEFGALAGHAGIEGQQIETVLETVQVAIRVGRAEPLDSSA